MAKSSAIPCCEPNPPSGFTLTALQIPGSSLVSLLFCIAPQSSPPLFLPEIGALVSFLPPGNLGTQWWPFIWPWELPAQSLPGLVPPTRLNLVVIFRNSVVYHLLGAVICMLWVTML